MSTFTLNGTITNVAEERVPARVLIEPLTTPIIDADGETIHVGPAQVITDPDGDFTIELLDSVGTDPAIIVYKLRVEYAWTRQGRSFPIVEFNAPGDGSTLELADLIGTAAMFPVPPDRGLPPGGTTGQKLGKASGADYDTEWVDVEAPTDASTTVKGIVELATSAEAVTGTDTVRAVTPAALQAKIDALVAAAPGTLDTLDELAAALGDDANYAATVTTALAGKASAADLAAHLADTNDAHDASAISNVPAGTIAATDVQSALNELDSEKAATGSVTNVANDLAAHLADTVDAHDASAISNVPAGNIAATDVQTALNELDTEKAKLTVVTQYTTAQAATAYVIPTGCVELHVRVQGGGGGGGGGRRGPAGQGRAGGGAGAGGGYTEVQARVADLGVGTIYVWVGDKGTGATATVADTTSGNDGTDGGASYVLSANAAPSTSNVIAHAGGGFKGLGGTIAAGNGGAQGWQGMSWGGAGTSGVNITGAQDADPVQGGAASGGGGGGGISSSNASVKGGAGNQPTGRLSTDGVGVSGGGAANGGNGAPGVDGPTLWAGGSGAGGGGGNAAGGVSGNGGNGARGAGGGGAGGVLNGSNSGVGGDGGIGYVEITAFF